MVIDITPMQLLDLAALAKTKGFRDVEAYVKARIAMDIELGHPIRLEADKRRLLNKIKRAPKELVDQLWDVPLPEDED